LEPNPHRWSGPPPPNRFAAARRRLLLPPLCLGPSRGLFSAIALWPTSLLWLCPSWDPKVSSGARPSGSVPPRIRRSCLGLGFPALLSPGPEGLVRGMAYWLRPSRDPKVSFGARPSGFVLPGTKVSFGARPSGSVLPGTKVSSGARPSGFVPPRIRRSCLGLGFPALLPPGPRPRSGLGLPAPSFPGPRPRRELGLSASSRPGSEDPVWGSAFRLCSLRDPKVSFGARPSGSVLPGTKASSGTRPSGFVPPRVRRSCLGFGLPALLPPRPEGLVRGSAMSLVCLGTPSEQGWNSLSGLSSLLVGLPLLRDESRRFEVAFEQSRQSSTVPDEAFLRAEALGIAYIWHLQVGLGRPIVLEPTSDSWSTKRPPPWSLSSCSGHAETCRNRPRWRCPFRGLHHPDNCVAPGALSLAASRSRRIDELCHPSPRPRPCSDPLSSPDCRKNRRLESDIGPLPGSIHLRLQRGPKTSPETGRPRARNFSPLGEIDSINVSISLFEKNVPNRRGPGSAPRFSTP
jgi:hypothetical protein